MRIVFMGTPEFAVPSLENLIQAGHTVSAVFSQPDKPKGRHFTLTPPPVKEAALRHGIPVYQPLTLKGEETAELIKNLEPDCIVVVAYGRILPETVLKIPRLGCINVHASLLPKYRGAGPIQWSVINGEAQTGVTTMFMAKGLDTGDMILQAATEIGENETTGELHDRLMKIGAETLVKTLTLLEQGSAPREVQDDTQSCYAPMIDKEAARIDWNRPAHEIHNLVRGMNPWPIANTILAGEIFKVLRTSKTSIKVDELPGTVLTADAGGITVACGGASVIRLDEVQAQGGKRMSSAQYVQGHGFVASARFGE